MKDIEAIIRDFFQLGMIEVETLDVIQEEKNIYQIKLQTPDSGRVIGPHGKNLAIFSQVIKLIIAKKLQKNVQVHLEVNDYAEQKEKKFFEFINSKIAQLESSGKDVKLPYLTAYERKKVHCFILEKADKDIFTQSIGEGSERRLFICKKTPSSESIDIDGVDI